MALIFDFEPLATLLDDGLGEIVREHWAAIAVDQEDVPLDVDWEAYQRREDNGTWRGFTARRDGRIVGYVGFFLFRPERYQSTLYINEDTIWIVPDEPNRGLLWYQLLKAAMAALPKPCKLQVKVRLQYGGDRTGKLLERLGLVANEMIYTGYFRD